jgi:hypothetical protein
MTTHFHGRARKAAATTASTSSLPVEAEQASLNVDAVLSESGYSYLDCVGYRLGVPGPGNPIRIGPYHEDLGCRGCRVHLRNPTWQEQQSRPVDRRVMRLEPELLTPAPRVVRQGCLFRTVRLGRATPKLPARAASGRSCRGRTRAAGLAAGGSRGPAVSSAPPGWPGTPASPARAGHAVAALR